LSLFLEIAEAWLGLLVMRKRDLQCVEWVCLHLLSPCDAEFTVLFRWQPVDPTVYQNDDIGKVIGMY